MVSANNWFTGETNKATWKYCNFLSKFYYFQGLWKVKVAWEVCIYLIVKTKIAHTI